MNTVVFIQRSRFGRTIFLLHADSLEVSSHLFGQRSSSTFPLTTISNDYEIRAQRNLGLVAAGLVVAGVCLSVLRFMLHQEGEFWRMFMYPPGMLLVASLIFTIAHYPRLEFFTFTDHWKRPLFSILRESEQAKECNAFVATLLDRLDENPKGESALDIPTERLIEEAPLQTCWLLAVIAGFIAASYPLLHFAPPPIDELTFLSLPVVIVAETTAVFATGHSFSRKERRRHFCWLAVIFCAVPFLFYL